MVLGDALDRLAAALAADRRLGLVAPRLQYPDGRPQFVWAPDRGVVSEARCAALLRDPASLMPSASVSGFTGDVPYSFTSAPSVRVSPSVSCCFGFVPY